MVNTKKFSEFAAAQLNDSSAVFVGVENGVNTKTEETKRWTTATRPATPYNGLLGFNTTLQQYEYYDSVIADWTQLEDSGDVNTILALLASHASGDGASLIGLQNQGAVVNKTVQDLANATFIARTDNGSLVNAQFLGALATGILKSTTTTGLLSISAPLTSIDGLTATGNQFLYSTGVNTYGLLATANDSVLITNGTGTPSFSQTLPVTVQDNITRLGTQSEDLNMGTHLINNVLDPISAQDAATKNYVDTVAAGLEVKASCRVATTTALTVTYNNGASGVGATLTNAGAMAALSIDGVSLSVNERVLVKNQASALQNGIYTVTNIGSGATNWVMTRATDYDTPSEVTPGTFVLIDAGTTNQNTGWVQTATVVAIGVDAINFSKFTNANAISRVVIQTFTLNGTYTPTSNMTYCIVEIVGGGGGSGGVPGAVGNGAASAGGGGGGYCRKLYTAAQIGANAAVVIGTGGAAGTAGANPGGTGVSSTFTPSGGGVTLTASGGAGGGAGAITTTVNVSSQGGAGGTGTNGDVNISGSTGGSGIVVGGSGQVGVGGMGGSSMLSNSRGGTVSGGFAGLNYGAGASGVNNLTGANQAGLAGADGICIITEYVL